MAMAQTPKDKPDATDAKGNKYYRRKLINREMLTPNIMRLTFQLPDDTSLKDLGFDIGYGDFVRMRPFTEEHKKLVDHPNGGRAYSPVSAPDEKGKFDLMVKVYGEGGLSSLFKTCEIGSEFLAASHVEHVYWAERKTGYYANVRNLEDDDEDHVACLIAFGIGITEIAPLALSELYDKKASKVKILWANKSWEDVAWVSEESLTDEASDHQDLVRLLFSGMAHNSEKLTINHILSQQKRTNCLHGRFNKETIKQVFMEDSIPMWKYRFVSVGTPEMTKRFYETLADLGFDIDKAKGFWTGQNFLFKKFPIHRPLAHRKPSPLTINYRPLTSAIENVVTEEEPKKKKKLKLERSFSLGGEKSNVDGNQIVNLDDVTPIEKEEAGFGGEFIKSFVFGGLDGIVSTFALVAGLGGASVNIKTLIAVSLAKILADAFSMGFGEYTSALAELENSGRLRDTQSKAFDELPEGEAKEMITMYTEKGMDNCDALTVVTYLMQYKHLFLEHILVLQHGISGGEDEDRFQALKQGFVCFLAFVLFGLVPLFGFIIFYAVDGGANVTETTILAIAYVLTATTLFCMGCIKAKLTGSGSALKSGALMVINGTVAGGSAYVIGEILAVALAGSR